MVTIDLFTAQSSNDMKTKLLLWCAAGLLVALTRASAATLYVDAGSTNAVPPFTNWITAAAVIQDAVDAAAPGDEIVVTNGVYQTGARAVYGMSNRVAVTKPVTVRSVNGPEVTVISGMGNTRCAYLTNGAVLTGFTLTNGTSQYDGDLYSDNCGGGAWCEGLDAVLSNCVVTGCWSYDDGGGVFGGTLNNCVLTGNDAFYGGGAFSSALNDCTLSDNWGEGGGGAYASTLNNCKLTNNGAWDGGGVAWSTLINCFLTRNTGETGGGALGCALNNCTLTGNSAEIGGGVHSSTLTNCTLIGNSADSIRTDSTRGGGAYGSTLENCLVTGNTAVGEFGAGGGVFSSTLNNCNIATNYAAGSGGGASGSTLNNCIIVGNSSGVEGGGGGASTSTLSNCTLTGNSAGTGGGATSSSLNNCILYYNSDAFGYANHAGCTFNYSCTTPAPGSGVGNITNAPLFVDTNGWSNLRLQSNSPCINAGNNASVATNTDLDGRPRIVGGVVDMGAYEYQGPGLGEFIGWLQQSGLPPDGSADDVDTDHDGHNNWQEWLAGTNPTNARSVLWLAAPVITPTNVTLTWTSVSNRTYTLEQATNLGDAPAFSVLRSNLVGLPGTTSWTDTNAPVASPRFYQLRVSP